MGHHVPSSDTPLEVAIIGAGVVGLNLALGLLHRNIPVKVYEQARELKEIGVGIGLSDHALDILGFLSPRTRQMIDPHGLPSPAMGYIDMTTGEDMASRPADQLYDVGAGSSHFTINVFSRATLAAELVKLLPEGTVLLGKRAIVISRPEDAGGLTEVKFQDGTSVGAHAVIGCDGVKSFVRRVVAGPDNPASVAHYAHESVYRGLVDFDKAAPILGAAARTVVIWVGQGGHVISYPIANYRYLNVAWFVPDENEWPSQDSHTIKSSKAELFGALASAGPSIKRLLDVLPEEQSRWGLFDTADHPLTSYVSDTIAVAGDAAHASTPHRGAGAIMGIEDALILVVLLEKLRDATRGPDDVGPGHLKTNEAVAEAFRIFDEARRPRSQWLVVDSRRQGSLRKDQVSDPSGDRNELLQKTMDGFKQAYMYDWKGEASRATKKLQDVLEGKPL